MEADPSEAGPVASVPRASGFRRELTPTWLHLACLLGGHRPPDLSGPFRYVHLGCGAGVTTSVVAAVHPEATVWAWSDRAADLESTARTGRAAGLDNLEVHERPGLPSDLGGELADLIVVEDLLTSGPPERRDELIAAVGRNLRPGGLACLVYRTTVAWSEIVPVQRVMRRVAQRHTGHPDDLVPEVLDLLDQLRKGGARHLTERPAVAAWLDDLMTADHATIIRDYLQDELRPLSHPEVAAALGRLGCGFVGSARFDEPYELSDELTEIVTTAPSPLLREAYRDLAARPDERLDVFRRGGAPLTEVEQRGALEAIDLLPADQVGTGDQDDLADRLRGAVGSGSAHPVTVSVATERAVAPAAALGSIFAASGVDALPLTATGSATSAAR